MDTTPQTFQTLIDLEKACLGNLSALEDQAKEALKASRARLAELRKQYERAQRMAADPVVTDHALVRYLERVRGIDMEEVKAAILTPKVREWLREFPTGDFPLEGHKVVIRDNKVVTVKPSKPKKLPRPVPRLEDVRAAEADAEIAEFMESRSL